MLLSSTSSTAIKESTTEPPVGNRFGVSVDAPRLKALSFEGHRGGSDNPQNDSYKAEIEEYWAGSDKWRRTVKTDGFSSDLIVNGQKLSESVSGDYYPNWLRTLVTAIFDPATPIRDLDLTVPYDDPMPGSGLLCRRYSSQVGIPPVQNRIFSTVCFRRDNLESVGLPGYDAEYKDYKNFSGKLVARTIREYIEPGTEVEATITELADLSAIDESEFAVTQYAPPIRTLTVTEDTLRKMANSSLELKWPPITGGKTEGVLSIYVCLDRTGRVRETYALNSDQPEMSDAAQQQVRSIQFTPTITKNESVQAEGILTFSYKTVIQDIAK